MTKVSRKVKDGESINYMSIPGLKVSLSREDVTKLKLVSESHMFNTIVATICQVNNLTVSDIQKKFGNDHTILTRQLCMYYLYIFGGMKLKQIAYLLRPDRPFDHSTVVHGRELIKEYLSSRNQDDFTVKVKYLCSQIDLKLKQLINESNSTNG